MRKIITIAESVLDTEYRQGKPVRSFVGGRIPCAAASLAMCGIETHMVSECTNDRVGDLIVDYLKKHKVDVTSIDRYPDGATAFSAIFRNDDGTSSIVNYGKYPDDRFNVIWPRIDKDDILIIGSLYSVDLPQRERLFELVSYAAERKAIIIYLPGFQHGINFRITRVMPNILENLEVADIVIAQQQDINTIFPGESHHEAYHNHLAFYCDNYLHITQDNEILHYTPQSHTSHASTSAPSDNWLGWQAGLTAGVAHALITLGVTHDTLSTLTGKDWDGIIDEALQWASASTGNENCITPEFANSRTEVTRQALMQYENTNKNHL